jgi:hypothetical protein
MYCRAHAAHTSDYIEQILRSNLRPIAVDRCRSDAALTSAYMGQILRSDHRPAVHVADMGVLPRSLLVKDIDH